MVCHIEWPVLASTEQGIASSQLSNIEENIEQKSLLQTLDKISKVCFHTVWALQTLSYYNVQSTNTFAKMKNRLFFA